MTIFILGFDSSANSVGVALLREGFLLGQTALTRPRSASELLPSLSQWLVDQLEMNLEELDGLAVTLGPGSFTGLRITSSLVSSLSLSQNIPAAGVVTTAGLAGGIHLPADSYAVAALDARGDAIYGALYYRPPARSLLPNCTPWWVPQQIIPPARRSVVEMVSLIRRHTPGDSNVFWIADGKDPHEEKEFIKWTDCRQGPTSFIQTDVNPAGVAYIGWQKLIIGIIDKPSDLHPRYFRKSAAQRASEVSSNGRG